MRTMSWIKHPVILLFVGSIAAGCGSDSKNNAGTGGADSGAHCGNKIKQTGEVCDGTDLDGKTCATATLVTSSTGTLGCAADCKSFDVSKCSGKGGGGGGGGKGGTAGTGTGGGMQQTGGGMNKGDGGPEGGPEGGTKEGGSGGAGGTGGTDSGTPPVDASVKG